MRALLQPLASDLDYLSARLHTRRSLIAEGDRLDELCRVETNAELAAEIHPEALAQSAAGFQLQLVQDLVDELSGLLPHLNVTGAGLVGWMLVRFQVENLKVLVRGIAAGTSPELLREHVVSLPRHLVLDTQALATAQSLDQFVNLIPKGPLRASAKKVIEVYGKPPKPFFLEGALDGGYFRELLARLSRLSGEDRELIQPLVSQEVDTFHLMLLARGKFHYGLTSELLLPLHVPGTGIPRARFESMLAVPDLLTAAGQAVGRVIDTLPQEHKGPENKAASVDAAALEALAWTRYLRLSNSAFRRSHMGLGAVVGYAGLRRVEVANLITVSEGVRGGIPAEAIRSRMIPRTEFVPEYV